MGASQNAVEDANVTALAYHAQYCVAADVMIRTMSSRLYFKLSLGRTMYIPLSTGVFVQTHNISAITFNISMYF